MIVFNDTQHAVLELSDRIVDNPNLHLYQAVYAGSLLLLLIAAYLNTHSYMAVSPNTVFFSVAYFYSLNLKLPRLKDYWSGWGVFKHQNLGAAIARIWNFATKKIVL